MLGDRLISCIALLPGGALQGVEEQQRAYHNMTSAWSDLLGPTEYTEEMSDQMLLSMERNASDSSFSTCLWGYAPSPYDWVSGYANPLLHHIVWHDTQAL